MAARDPQTGQFVSGGGTPGLPGYENLEIQVVTDALAYQADAVTGNSVHEQWASFEPVGGLQRGEFAELVAIVGVEMAHGEGIAGNEDPGSCSFHYEMSLDPELHGGRDTVRDEDVDGVTGHDTVVLEAVDPDILRHNKLTSSIGFDDDTNGNGGQGALVDRSDVMLGYRGLLGGGPVLDRHDQMYLHAESAHVGDGNSKHVLHIDYLLYWSIFEE